MSDALLYLFCALVLNLLHGVLVIARPYNICDVELFYGLLSAYCG